MKRLEFVDALREHARDTAVASVFSVLERPPGRRPAARLLELSEWFGRLTPSDKERLRQVLELSAAETLFGVLAIIDGSRQVEGHGPKGTFEIRHVDADGTPTLIAGPTLSPLHELL